MLANVFLSFGVKRRLYLVLDNVRRRHIY
uniref:Uncharacterized protein n=1 Tax=Arundo donax TaxID=35708 RepID=A0A0A9FYR0_ARUDO